MRFFWSIAALSLLACNPNLDTDGDGLTDREEAELGTDPESADSDGDGLDDRLEIEIGSDPFSFDTDDDGYDDWIEVEVGTDPSDSDSVYYVGGWPYCDMKDDIDDPGFVSNGVQEDAVFARFKAVDQFGDEVDIYDFAYQGKPILVDISAEWCGPCNSMASWMDGDTSSSDFDYWESQYGPLREAVDAGEIIWITILAERSNGNPAGPKTPSRWFNKYPHEKVPVLADSDYVMAEYANVYAWPTALLLNEDMTVDTYKRKSYSAALKKATALAEGGDL